MMHFCAMTAITKSNECSLFACFESLQCPKIVLTVIKKGMFFKSLRAAAPDPARGLQRPPRPPAGFHLGRSTLSYRATALMSCPSHLWTLSHTRWRLHAPVHWHTCIPHMYICMHTHSLAPSTRRQTHCCFSVCLFFSYVLIKWVCVLSFFTCVFEKMTP